MLDSLLSSGDTDKTKTLCLSSGLVQALGPGAGNGTQLLEGRKVPGPNSTHLTQQDSLLETGAPSFPDDKGFWRFPRGKWYFLLFGWLVCWLRGDSKSSVSEAQPSSALSGVAPAATLLLWFEVSSLSGHLGLPALICIGS